MKKRKILFLIPSLVGGGAERALINLLHQIDKNKYSIDILSVLNKGIYINQLPQNIHLITLFNNEFVLRCLSWLQKKVGFVLIQKIMFNHKIKKHYDLGISFLDSNFTDYLFFSNSFNKRITWVHSAYKSYTNFFKYYQNPKYKQKLIKQRYQKLDGICFVSQDAMNEFVDIFGKYKNMQVIYNIFNSEQIQKKANEKITYDRNKFTFISIGNLLPVKGYDRLIRSAKIISEQGYDFNVLILGSGVEENKLKKLIAKFNLSGQIHMLGFIKNPYPYIALSDAFVMPSLSEALPTALCEAMILKKPVIVTDCSGCREIVNNGEFGLIAEQNDSDLAEKMMMLMNDKGLLNHFKIKSMERSSLFNDEKNLKNYYNIFDQ